MQEVKNHSFQALEMGYYGRNEYGTHTVFIGADIPYPWDSSGYIRDYMVIPKNIECICNSKK